MESNLELLTVLMCWVTMVTSFPYGPPPTNYTCKEMFPMGHEVNAQFSNPPYEIKLSMNLYTKWEEVNVTINATKGRVFRGFYLQARRANCAHEDRQVGLGVFNPRTDEIKPYDCVGGTKNAVSHTDSDPKRSITVMWNAPGATVGHIYFVATVVESRSVFWTNVYSDVLRQADSSAGASICQSRMLRDPHGKTKTTPQTSTDRQRSGSESANNLSTTVLILMVLARTLATMF